MDDGKQPDGIIGFFFKLINFQFMLKNSTRKITIIFFGQILFLTTWHGVSVVHAKNILIFSPLENNLANIKVQDIIFEVEISAFSPILVAKINGRIEKTTPSTWVRIRIPYRLKVGKNIIVVDASTEFETASKEFVINYKRKKKVKKKEPFQFITVLGNQNSSNVLKDADPDTATEGSRNFLVLMPRYDWWLSNTSALRFQSIISRDKYSQKELQGEEISFTQITASWLKTFNKADSWQLGLGSNLIYQKYKSVAQGETKLETDSFIYSNLKQHLGKTGLYELSLEYKQMEFAETPVGTDSEENGTALTVKGKLEGDLSVFRGKTTLGYTNTDAVGKFKDKSTSKWSAELSLPLGNFITGLGFRQKTTKYKEGIVVSDELVTPIEKLNTFLVNALYMISKSWIITMEYLQDKRNANIAASEYENVSYSSSLIFIY